MSMKQKQEQAQTIEQTVIECTALQQSCPHCSQDLRDDQPDDAFDAAPDPMERCPQCDGALILREKYVISELLGSGGQGRTFLGHDAHEEGKLLAVKELMLSRTRDWKSVELFKRSADVLKDLDHPGVPRLIEYFQTEYAGVTYYYLVQEFIDGENLDRAMSRGERFGENDVGQIALKILDILEYLHRQPNPVIHRDLKPSNIMRRPSGELVLIDFDIVRHLSGPAGSTIAIGTPGFAPLEQYVGRAVPATDLYALGATMVNLLSRKDPAAIMTPGSPLMQFEPHINVGPRMRAVLHKMLEPDVAERYTSCRDVQRELQRLEQNESAEVTTAATAKARDTVPKKSTDSGSPKKPSASNESVPSTLSWWQRHWSVATIGLPAIVGMFVLFFVTSKEFPDHEPGATPTLTETLSDERTYTEQDNRLHHLGAEEVGRELESFDPLREIWWAVEQAQRWSADATLIRIEVLGARSSTLNLVDDNLASVTYVFESPERVARYFRNVATDNEPVETSYKIKVSMGAAQHSVFVSWPDDDDLLGPLPDVDCGLGDILDEVRPPEIADSTRCGANLGRDHDGTQYLDTVVWSVRCDYDHRLHKIPTDVCVSTP